MDQDCDAVEDADGDGLVSSAFFGRDCNDADAKIGKEACLESATELARGIGQIAIDGAVAYVLAADEIVAVPLDGSTPTDACAAVSPGGIAIDGTDLLFGEGPVVMRVPLAGGTPVPFSTLAGDVVALDTWGDAYVASTATQLYTLSADGLTIAVLGTADVGISDLDVVGDTLYYATATAVRSHDLADEAAVHEDLGTSETPNGLGVDAEYVYWVDVEGDLRRISRGGVHPTPGPCSPTCSTCLPRRCSASRPSASRGPRTRAARSARSRWRGSPTRWLRRL